MTWIHDQLFPTLIILTSIQTRVFADIFYLQREMREGGKQWRETKWKTNIQCKLFKQLLRSAGGGVKLELHSIPSGDPKWKPTVARQSSEVWKGDSRWWGSVILPSQSGVGWDQEWRLLDKCSSNTKRSSCNSIAYGAPHALKCLQTPSVKSSSREMQVQYIICQHSICMWDVWEPHIAWHLLNFLFKKKK